MMFYIHHIGWILFVPCDVTAYVPWDDIETSYTMIVINSVSFMIFDINLFVQWDENISSYKMIINRPMGWFLLV